MHLVNGYDLPIAKFQHLHYILRGIKRIKGASTPVAKPARQIGHAMLIFLCL